jgi:anti-sigma factor RsiW
VSCDLTQSVLHGYIDGELDAARAADFERHLVSCPECVAALEAQETLHASLQSNGLYERAPASLRQKVRVDLGGATDVRAPIPIAARSASWRWLAAAAAFLLVGFLSWRLIPGLRENPESTYAAAVIDAHLRSLQPGHLDDVVSTDQHTVKPWFDGKLDFAPPVQDFAAQGFPLQGGRLDVVHGHTVAVLVYARRKHVINVFVWPTTESGATTHSGTQLGYHWVDWRKGGMEMCAVSDVNPEDLAALRQLLTN